MMSAYRLNLKPGGIIPPAITMGVMLHKSPVLPKVAIVPETPAPIVVDCPCAAPAGSDVWYTAYRASTVPYECIKGKCVTMADTPNTDFGVDDNFDFEGDITDLARYPIRSAWWVLTVPDGVNATLTADTWQSEGGRNATNIGGDPIGPAARPTDTNLTIVTATDGVSYAPGFYDVDSVRFDFTGLTIVAQSDDDPDPADSTRQFTSKVTDVPLDGGKTYFIRVDSYNGTPYVNSDAVTYRLRLCLTEVE